VLVSPTTLPYLTKTSDNPEGLDASVFESFRQNLLLRDFPKWMEDNAAPFVVKETSPEMRAWLKGLALQTSMRALVECQRTSTSTDLRGELRRINVPTLIIQGDRDASGSVEFTGKRAAALIPGAQIRIYEGAPHGLFVTHIDRLNADLLAFAKG
jgi:pimeloyl-ACP methyl ester carboxylesterase